jgi:hypothetical protein
VGPSDVHDPLDQAPADVRRLHEEARRRPERPDGWYELAAAVQDGTASRTAAQSQLVLDALSRFLDLAPRNDRRRADALERFNTEIKHEARRRYEAGDLTAPVT